MNLAFACNTVQMSFVDVKYAHVHLISALSAYVAQNRSCLLANIVVVLNVKDTMKDQMIH